MAQEIPIESKDAETARAEIERTRARMSETIDEIEDVLLQTKERLQDRLDVRVRIRKKPIPAAVAVLGVGVILGFLTGGGENGAKRRIDAGDRAARWEARARRLLEIAQEQERDLERLETAIADADSLDHEDWEDSRVDRIRSRIEQLTDGWSESAVDFLIGAGQSIIERARSRR